MEKMAQSITSNEKVKASSKRLVLQNKNIGLWAGLLVFALVFVFFSVKAQGFLTQINLVRNLLMPASIAAVIALGMTIVYVGGGVDLSIAVTAGLSGLAVAATMAKFDLSLPLLFLVALFSGAIIGAINGLLVAYVGISPFVVTLSVVFLAEGLQYLITLGVVSGTYIMLPREIMRLGSKPGFMLGICAAASILLYIFLDHTIFGRHIRTVGQNITVSNFSGIKTRFYTWLTYVLCGAFAAIGGVMLTFAEGMARVGSGESYLIDAFMLPILGNTIFGRFSVEGTIFGALFMYMLINGLFILGAPPEMIRIVKGVLLLAVILVSGIQKMVSKDSH
jgi:ribose transport system permease protein